MSDISHLFNISGIWNIVKQCIDVEQLEYTLAEVNQSGLALEYTSSELQNNREVVITAVNNNGWALEFASTEVRNNREVVKPAVTKKGEELAQASTE